MTDATTAGQQGITGAVTGGQQRIDAGTAQAQQLLQPYIGAGGQSLSTLMGGLAPGGDLNKTFTAARTCRPTIRATPSGWRRRTRRSRDRQPPAAALSAAGALTALSSLNQNLASGEFANAEQRFRAQQTDRFNQISIRS